MLKHLHVVLVMQELYQCVFIQKYESDASILRPAAWPDAPEQLDVTQFLTDSPALGGAARGAAELVALANAARAFTDTAGFTLRCGVCQVRLHI